MFLWVKKQVEIAGREVRTVRRMVQYIPLEFFQKRCGERPSTFRAPSVRTISCTLIFLSQLSELWS